MLSWDCWSPGLTPHPSLDRMGLGLAPSSSPGEVWAWWDPPQMFASIGAIPSGEGLVWTCEQQSKAPRGLGSPGSPSGTEGELPGAGGDGNGSRLCR